MNDNHNNEDDIVKFSFTFSRLGENNTDEIEENVNYGKNGFSTTANQSNSVDNLNEKPSGNDDNINKSFLNGIEAYFTMQEYKPMFGEKINQTVTIYKPMYDDKIDKINQTVKLWEKDIGTTNHQDICSIVTNTEEKEEVKKFIIKAKNENALSVLNKTDKILNDIKAKNKNHFSVHNDNNETLNKTNGVTNDPQNKKILNDVIIDNDMKKQFTL